MAGDGADRADLDRAFREPAQRIDFFTRMLGFALEQHGVRQQRLPECRQGHPLAVTLEQRRAEIGFEPFDGTAQRGLREMQLGRGASETAGLDDGRESAQLLEIEAHEGGGHSRGRNETERRSGNVAAGRRISHAKS